MYTYIKAVEHDGCFPQEQYDALVVEHGEADNVQAIGCGVWIVEWDEPTND